jgi:hypothetical protein
MRAKKVDANQAELVKQIRKIPGATVKHTHVVGDGFVDIVVGYRKRNFLFEIKDPSQPPSKRKLTEDEEKFHKEWTGHVAVVETIDDVVRELNATTLQR